jgi:hypothetical protein
VWASASFSRATSRNRPAGCASSVKRAHPHPVEGGVRPSTLVLDDIGLGRVEV